MACRAPLKGTFVEGNEPIDPFGPTPWMEASVCPNVETLHVHKLTAQTMIRSRLWKASELRAQSHERYAIQWQCMHSVALDLTAPPPQTDAAPSTGDLGCDHR